MLINLLKLIMQNNFQYM